MKNPLSAERQKDKEVPYANPEDRRRYYEENKEQILKKSAKRYAANREKIRQQQADYYTTHQEKIRENVAEYRKSARGKIKEARKVYYETNREIIRNKNARYYAENRTKILEQKSQYAVKNRKGLREKNRLWVKENPEKMRAIAARKNAQRRSRKMTALRNDLTSAQWQAIKEYYANRCVYCGEKPKRLTMDHITPLSKGGSHTVQNIVPACHSCNLRKRTGPPLKPVQPLLLL